MSAKNAFLIILASLLLTACSYDAYNSSGSVHTRVGVTGYYDSGYDDFYFYPDVSVYLGINSGRYYYRPHDSWVGVRVLPGHINLHPSHRVRINKLPHDRPYRHYRDHHDRYRPDRHFRDHHDRYRR